MSEERKMLALRVEGPSEMDLEGKLSILKNTLQQCATQNIPENEIQRFLGRIFMAAKSAGFMVGVSHAIFKKDRDHIRLLEASLNESTMGHIEKKKLVDRLLSVALPSGLNQSTNGLSWTRDESSSSDESEKLFIHTATETDSQVVEEATTQTEATNNRTGSSGKIGI